MSRWPADLRAGHERDRAARRDAGSGCVGSSATASRTERFAPLPDTQLNVVFFGRAEPHLRRPDARW